MKTAALERELIITGVQKSSLPYEVLLIPLRLLEPVANC